MLRFIQKRMTPVIAAGDLTVPASWWGLSALGTACIVIGDTVYLYFRAPLGTDDNVHPIGLLTQPVAGFDPFTWSKWTNMGIIVSPDSIPGITGPKKHLANMNVTAFGGQYWLHYTVQDSVSSRFHAMSSTDGITWVDQGDCLGNGASFGGGSPSVANINGVLWLLHSGNATTGGFFISSRTSIDGKVWTNFSSGVILPTAGSEWNGQSVESGSLFYESPYVYAFVWGSPKFNDYPEAIGLFRASETDATKWTQYGANPVYLRGPAGSGTEAANWYFLLRNIGGQMWALYDGCGSRSLANSTISNNTMDIQYSGYNVTAFDQVFATQPQYFTTLADAWALGNMVPPGKYTLKNMATGVFATATGDANSSPILGYQDQTSPGAVWTFSMVDGFYAIAANGKVMELPGVSRATDAAVNIYDLVSGVHFDQVWHLVDAVGNSAGSGTYYIVNRNSGMCLSAPSGSTGGSGIVISQRAYDGTATQRWLVQPTASRRLPYGEFRL